jgi:hypothetical protein
MMKFSRAISRAKWLSGEKTNVSKTISVLVLNHLTRLIAPENFIIFATLAKPRFDIESTV